MGSVCQSYPQPTDDFGVLWALGGIRDAVVLEHGPTGTMYFNGVMNLGAVNMQYPKGRFFTTGLEPEDVVLGGEDRLIAAVQEIDDRHRPEVISVVATAVTSVIGVDLAAIVREIQPRVRARLLSFDGAGFRGNDACGIQEVFRTLTRTLVGECEHRAEKEVNIIGPTMETFNHPSDFAELERLLKLLGVKVNTVYTNATTVAGIRNASRAALNLVTRDLGVETAEIFSRRFGIPYIRGLPFGHQETVRWLEKVGDALGCPVGRDVLGEEIERYGHMMAELTSRVWRQDFQKLKVAIACSYDVAAGLAKFIREELGLQVVLVVLPSEPDKPGDSETFGRLGISRVLIASETETLQAALSETVPHILFGGADVSHLAPEIPIHIRSAIPAFDCVRLYDRTPFIGFRGALYLTQKIINEAYRHREILA